MTALAPASQYKAMDINPFSVFIQIMSYKKEKTSVLWFRISFVMSPSGIQRWSVWCTLEDKQTLKQKSKALGLFKSSLTLIKALGLDVWFIKFWIYILRDKRGREEKQYCKNSTLINGQHFKTRLKNMLISEQNREKCQKFKRYCFHIA